MTALNNLLIEQGNIFLAPGCYFHSEFNGVGYNDFPPLLQRKHNQQLIQQYALPLPNEKTPLLPKVLSEHWALLPEVALGLGVLLHAEPLPWWVELSKYRVLHTRLSRPLWQSENQPTTSPQRLTALGAQQLLMCLTPFGATYTLRAKYMFSLETQQLIPSSVKTMLPWNTIEETCRYVRENTPKC
ncbi:hypothetical protein KDV38_03015 [Providencia rettgeri]